MVNKLQKEKGDNVKLPSGEIRNQITRGGGQHNLIKMIED